MGLCKVRTSPAFLHEYVPRLTWSLLFSHTVCSRSAHDNSALQLCPEPSQASQLWRSTATLRAGQLALVQNGNAMMRRAGWQRVALCADDALIGAYEAHEMHKTVARCLAHEQDDGVRLALYECLERFTASRQRLEWLHMHGLKDAVKAAADCEKGGDLHDAARKCLSRMA